MRAPGLRLGRGCVAVRPTTVSQVWTALESVETRALGARAFSRAWMTPRGRRPGGPFLSSFLYSVGASGPAEFASLGCQTHRPARAPGAGEGYAGAHDGGEARFRMRLGGPELIWVRSDAMYLREPPLTPGSAPARPGPPPRP